ncbi:MAG: hypothetical protein QGD94_05000, partial [Planctomycetia bacterium]|nr:hypothetical protein [Planctomycetia bacterium]
ASIGEKPDIIIGEPVHYEHRQEGFRAKNQALPLGYGRIGSHVLILMFSDPSVRLFTVNAGGHFFCSPVQNPAWDFEWVVENYPLGESIGFDGRLVYTSFDNAECVVERYRKWVNECRV